MGGIVWNEWARLMCLNSSWIIVVGGILGCFQPMPGFDAMRKLPMLYDHPVPVLPAILILLGIIIFVIEYPLVGKAYLTSSDSYMPRVAFYIPLAVLSLLEGQTVNGGVYLAIGAVAYMMAIRAEFRKQQTKTGSRMP